MILDFWQQSALDSNPRKVGQLSVPHLSSFSQSLWYLHSLFTPQGLIAVHSELTTKILYCISKILNVTIGGFPIEIKTK